MNPRTKRDNLLTQAVGDELVIYDTQSCHAHRLNPTAATVWQAADGERSIGALSSILRRSFPGLSSPLSEAEGETLVRVAIEELDRAGLVERGLPAMGAWMSRREMIGTTAALLPVIASIVAPAPAMAKTDPPVTDYAFYNGLYSGTGSPSSLPSANPCGLGSRPVTIALNLTLAGTGSMTITHLGVGALPSVSFVSVLVTATVFAPQQIEVIGDGTTGGVQPTTTTNRFVFEYTRIAGTVRLFTSGLQRITIPGCGTGDYFISANKT
jgi:coenzyme PQQ synthesis protein D (PqqD)